MPEDVRWKIDECLSPGGFYTIRPYDGTPNGNTEAQPIATVYREEDARLIAAAPDLLKVARAYRNFLRTYACDENLVATYQHIDSLISVIEGE